MAGDLGKVHLTPRDKVVDDLLDSIAQEEMALASLVDAEASKLKAFVGDCCNFPTNPSNHEIITINKSVTRLLETVVMKEWLLLKKLEDVIDFHCKLHPESCHCCTAQPPDCSLEICHCMDCCNQDTDTWVCECQHDCDCH